MDPVTLTLTLCTAPIKNLLGPTARAVQQAITSPQKPAEQSRPSRPDRTDRSSTTADQRELARQQAFLKGLRQPQSGSYAVRETLGRLGASPVPASPLLAATSTPVPTKPAPHGVFTGPRLQTRAERDLRNIANGQPFGRMPQSTGTASSAPERRPVTKSEKRFPVVFVDSRGNQDANQPAIVADRDGMLYPRNTDLPGVYVLDPDHPYSKQRPDPSKQAEAQMCDALFGSGSGLDTENPLVRGAAGLGQRDPMHPLVDVRNGQEITLHLTPRAQHPRYQAAVTNPRLQAADGQIRRDVSSGTAYAPSQEGVHSWRSWATLGLGPLAERTGRSLGLSQGYGDNRSRQVYGYGQADERLLGRASDAHFASGMLDGTMMIAGVLPTARLLDWGGRTTVSAGSAAVRRMGDEMRVRAGQELVTEAGGYARYAQGATTPIPSVRVATNAAPVAGPRLGTLRKVGENTWESSSGLRYAGFDQQGLNRVRHLMRHTVDDPQRAVAHGFFTVPKDQVLATVDEAWMAQRSGRGLVSVQVQSNGRTSYIIDMGRAIGKQGGLPGAAAGNPELTHLRIVLKNGNEVVTAYPVAP